MTTAAIVSGGLDSTVLAYYARFQDNGDTPALISFDYGQRHRKELNYAQQTAFALNAQHTIVTMSELGHVLEGSALTDDAVDVPEGHYAASNMAATVVPNRNAIMLSVAWGICVARGFDRLVAGMHAGDHPIYPDCRPAFIDSLNAALRIGTDGYAEEDLRLEAPFVRITKADIVRIGHGLSVPWLDTWSCYKGGELHCGACGTCVERREAFALAGVDDPTEYEATPEFAAP